MTLRVGVFHPGTQHSWQTALAFQESGQLGWYATSIFYDPARWPYRIEGLLPQPLSARLHREFSRRHLPALQTQHVRRLSHWEWFEAALRRAGKRGAARWVDRHGNAAFAKSVIRLIEGEPVDTVWGYDTFALEVFRWAKSRGIRCVLDQTIGHCASLDRVMRRERERHPEFFLDSYRPVTPAEIDRQNEELALADLVVAGSAFCASTLVEHGCPPSKIRIVPYGYDETLFPSERAAETSMPELPLRFLFVGAIHARKGVAHLLKAFQDISPELASLTLVGGCAVPAAALQPYGRRVHYVRSVPRREVVKHFLAADCFILPSLFEGSAIVLREAAAAGLGIVQSRAAGDGVSDGRNGEILDEVSPNAIRSAVLGITENRDELRRWQQASWDMRLEHTWQRYRERARTLIAA